MKNENIKNKEIYKRLEWENDKEYNYRIKVNNILNAFSTAIGNINKLAKNVKNLDNQRKMFQDLFDQLKEMKIPERYIVVHEYVKNQINSYTIAMELLCKGLKDNDVDSTRSAGVYIKEGNLWMKITEIYMWRAIEEEVKKIRNTKN